MKSCTFFQPILFNQIYRS